MSDQKKDELNISPELFKEIRNEICYSKDELHDWIKTYLNIDIPNTTISENSNGNPMDMIWWCYNNAIHSTGKTSKKAMFVASRGGMKTLGASIIELLMVSHAKRDVVHIGAILKTAKRCYQYFQGFFRQNGFDDLLFRDSNGNIKQPVMEKTILSNGTSLEILPCTLAACNGPHTPFVCIGGNTEILIENTNNMFNTKRDRVVLTMKRVVELVQSGEKIKAYSYNFNTKQIEPKLVTRAEKTGKKERLKIELGNSKHKTIWCTEEHKFVDFKTKQYKEARKFRVGDEMCGFQKIQTKSLDRKYKKNKYNLRVLEKQDLDVDQEFEQTFLGSLLGDGSLNGRHQNSKRLYYSEGHGEKQKQYLTWKKNKLSKYIEFYDDKKNFSGYTKKHSGLRINGKLDYELTNSWKNFRHNFEVFSRQIQKMDRLALAVWYMDDGCKNSFHTESFSLEQVQSLKDILKKKFDVNTYIKQTTRGYYILNLKNNIEVSKLYCLVECYIHPELKYKLNFKTIYNCSECDSIEFRINTSNNDTKCLSCINASKDPLKPNKILKITKVKVKRDVFDITVKDNHNFFAGGVLTKNCLDEIDAVQDMQGYDDISGIPVKTKDGKPPIEIGISTMKTASGLVAQEINAAPKTGLEVFYWNIIDLTKKCPDSRSGTKKIPIYANLDTLEAISEEEWKDRTDSERKNFEKREGLEGCLSRCKMFSACLGNLKNQTSDSHMLNDVEFTEQKIFSKAPEWVNAQLLCRKPSLEGIIYSRFTNKGNIKSYQQMYEIFTGQSWPHKRNCSFDDLRSEFSKAGIRPNMAVDFGDHLAVLLLIYTDGKDRNYVVKEKTFTATDDAELAHWATTNWGKYDVNMVYADPASPSGIRLLTKAGFVCHHKVNKDVWGGINTVRRFINVPGTNRSALFVHESCENLIYEFPRYSRKYNKSLDVFMEDPVKKEDHSLDCLRYYLHTKYDGMEAHLGFFDDHIKEKDKRTEAPDVEQIAIENGIMGFVDNSDDFIRDEETGELRKKTDVEKNNESGGGGFSFF